MGRAFPGKRESRRFKGYYMLTQQDIIEQHEHYDAVSFGGWSIDLHPADGVYGAGRACNQWHSKGIYQIPYRCLVTPDADNLFIGGRIISVSHVANGSTRVMCTAAHGGQAIGMAAAIALRDHLKPADLIGRSVWASCSPHCSAPDTSCRANGSAAACCPEGPDQRIQRVCARTAAPRRHPLRLDCSAAELIPVGGPVPAVGLTVQADKATRLTVELRSSSRRGTTPRTQPTSGSFSTSGRKTD
ncbi:MAG: FAD-dependent oxidoreductase [Alistipes finegoldii]